MKLRHVIAASTAMALVAPAAALAQSAPVNGRDAPDTANPPVAEDAVPPGDAQLAPVEAAQSDSQDIVVTARQREERLQDVPIAVTAISGDFIKQQQLVTVKDVAAFAPGLTINSDSAGRAFVSIRGIGTTVIDSVQPGVGIFIDGVYQPNTTFLNSPLVDVARVEVLRGPQGTLFGNNTLGGAINVITRLPRNEWEGRVDGALASGDNFGSVSASVSGPIVPEVLQVRIGAAYHTQDGFGFDTLAGGDQNPLETKSVNGTVRFLPADWATFTINGSYDRVFGGNVPYFTATGPTDYRLEGQTNVLSRITIDYYGASVKGEFQVDPIKTKITAIAAYNQSDTTSNADADFSPLEFFRTDFSRVLKTYTGEVRFDTQWSDRFSTLIGAFASRYDTDVGGSTIITFLDPPLSVPSPATSRNDTRAVFGTAFLKLGDTLDFTAGIRYDRQKLTASTAGLPAAYKADEWQPRATLTKRWTPEFMTYASVARGVRGGGQNGPGAPNLIYRGDSVWTYEVGTKASALDGRLQGNVALFYNDYKDYIGPNALAPSTIIDPSTGQPAGFVAVNLNTGDAETYGAEAELNFQATRDLRLYGNLTLLHARVTDASQFLATTGFEYPGNRVPFVPALTYAVGANLRLPFTDKHAVVVDANVVGKGRRFSNSLDIASQPFLESYNLVNASVGWQTTHFDVALFATNLFNEKYIESYLDKSFLGRAGLPAPLVNNLVIQGNRRRVGLRGTVRF